MQKTAALQRPRQAPGARGALPVGHRGTARQPRRNRRSHRNARRRGTWQL